MVMHCPLYGMNSFSELGFYAFTKGILKVCVTLFPSKCLNLRIYPYL